MAALNPQMIFRRGDKVEVASLEQGFLGSYYEATVVAELTAVKEYIVEYETLVKDDFSGPLCEVVTAGEVRPRPPEVRMREEEEFQLRDLVDAFDNDGWWVGKITGKVGDTYMVYFECSKEEIGFSVDRLRVHLDWVHGRAKWSDPMKRALMVVEV